MQYPSTRNKSSILTDTWCLCINSSATYLMNFSFCWLVSTGVTLWNYSSLRPAVWIVTTEIHWSVWDWKFPLRRRHHHHRHLLRWWWEPEFSVHWRHRRPFPSVDPSFSNDNDRKCCSDAYVFPSELIREFSYARKRSVHTLRGTVWARLYGWTTFVRIEPINWDSDTFHRTLSPYGLFTLRENDSIIVYLGDKTSIQITTLPLSGYKLFSTINCYAICCVWLIWGWAAWKERNFGCGWKNVEYVESWLIAQINRHNTFNISQRKTKLQIFAVKLQTQRKRPAPLGECTTWCVGATG